MGRVWDGGTDNGSCFIINSGKLVSAQHVLVHADSSWRIEFNVPDTSDYLCILRHPAPEDQYAIDLGTVVMGSGDEGDD